MGSRPYLLVRLLILALALATVLGLSSAQATGAKARTHGETETCTWGASSTHATVVDGHVTQAVPATTGCPSR